MLGGILRPSHVWKHFICVINALHTNSYCSSLEFLGAQRSYHLLDHQLRRLDLAFDQSISVRSDPVLPEPL